MALRVVFFGTPAFAEPPLQRLLTSEHHVVGVVTQPDRPRGRGQRVSPGPVKLLAVARGLPVLQPERLTREELEPALTALEADIGVVAAYGKILPAWLLTALPRGFVNVHASLLPRYRGASPVHRAVIAGETETGVTIMRVVQALDAGPMLAQERVSIGPDQTSADVERQLALAGGRLLVETLDRLAKGRVAETPQDDGLATYAPRLEKREGLVDWARPASAIHNLIRGLHPWPHAFSFLSGARVILHRSRLTGTVATASTPGTIVTARPADGLRVACGDESVLDITELQLEGKRVMAAREALTRPIFVAGARFGRP
jgi:methionyl-tRNA formyltransferase